jgi:hypothetical protein
MQWKQSTFGIIVMITVLLLAGFSPMIVNIRTVEGDPGNDLTALSTDSGVPSPPLNVTVTSDPEGLTINWSEPASIGGSEIQNYIVRIFAGDPSNYSYGIQISFGEGTALSTHVETAQVGETCRVE